MLSFVFCWGNCQAAGQERFVFFAVHAWRCVMRRANIAAGVFLPAAMMGEMGFIAVLRCEAFGCGPRSFDSPPGAGKTYFTTFTVRVEPSV